MDTFASIKSDVNVAANKKRLLLLQDSTSLVVGIAAGILQLESLNGFYMFIGSFLSIGALYIIWICQLKPHKYYQSPVQEVFFEPFFRELMGFVMAWTFSYALIG
ncbi:hypothetical protein HG536_0E04440 [Torulaspora globosa]|uniref:ER membrane protein complex subunit 6 n=1 Tax=Torulaspora globosa TaxID=48254 RepID=A0A7G3ZJ47_9SACH|nr:uncharacterized protein HG536_0E04440 [Torulaspora globosa]QLL33533.1 hypothetical protein HG536_0E04440 [Torulaspora globosa]